MPPTPEGHWPKIIRAEEHIAAIRSEIDYYREGEPYRVVGKFISDTQYVVRVERNYPPSPKLSLLIGDCTNCLRSALDHLAFALVTRYAPDRLDAPKSISFPIFDSRFNRKGEKVHVLAGVAGCPESAQAIIEAHQPYHRGDLATWHPLSVLSRLANTDKHRELLITGGLLSHGLIRISCHGVPLASQLVMGRFKAKTEMAILDVGVADAQAAGCLSGEEMTVEADAHLVVTFNESEPPADSPVLDVLEEIRAEVFGLIEALDLPFLA